MNFLFRSETWISLYSCIRSPNFSNPRPSSLKLSTCIVIFATEFLDNLVWVTGVLESSNYIAACRDHVELSCFSWIIVYSVKFMVSFKSPIQKCKTAGHVGSILVCNFWTGIYFSKNWVFSEAICKLFRLLLFAQEKDARTFAKPAENSGFAAQTVAVPRKGIRYDLCTSYWHS